MDGGERVERGRAVQADLDEEDRVWREETLAGQIDTLQRAAGELWAAVRRSLARPRREE